MTAVAVALSGLPRTTKLGELCPVFGDTASADAPLELLLSHRAGLDRAHPRLRAPHPRPEHRPRERPAHGGECATRRRQGCLSRSRLRPRLQRPWLRPGRAKCSPRRCRRMTRARRSDGSSCSASVSGLARDGARARGARGRPPRQRGADRGHCVARRSRSRARARRERVGAHRARRLRARGHVRDAGGRASLRAGGARRARRAWALRERRPLVARRAHDLGARSARASTARASKARARGVASGRARSDTSASRGRASGSTPTRPSSLCFSRTACGLRALRSRRRHPSRPSDG